MSQPENTTTETTVKHILIVEDNSVLSDVMRFNLERAGFKVTVAANGQQGLQFLTTQKFDLMITDFQMPGVNGAGLCQGVREELKIHDMPILMCSAKGLELDAEELRHKWQVSQLLFKPFSMREIVSFAKTLTTSPTLMVS
jgi:DNA-binding response OmpR family regulator